MNASPFKRFLHQTAAMSRDFLFTDHTFQDFLLLYFTFLSCDLAFGSYQLSLQHGKGLLPQGVGLDHLQAMMLRTIQLGQLLLRW